MDLKLIERRLLGLFGSKLFNFNILKAHDVAMTAESDMAFAALRSLVLRVGLINFIKVGLHNDGTVKLHFHLRSIDGHGLLIPLPNWLEMTLLGSD